MSSSLLTSLLTQLLSESIMFHLDHHAPVTPTINLLEPKKFIEWAKHYMVIPYLHGSQQRFILSDGTIEIIIECPSHSIPVNTIKEWDRMVAEEIDRRQGN